MPAESLVPVNGAVVSPATVLASAVPTSTQANPSGVTTPTPVATKSTATTAIITKEQTNTRTAQTIPLILPAATTLNGQIQPAEIPIVATGNVFYLRSANGELDITPFRAGAAGTENTFGVGQGREVGNGFENLSIKNFNLFPVVGLLWIGWDNFINNQLIIDNAQQPQIGFPTYPIPNSATSLNITDRSGQAINDINGGQWLALYRIAIMIFNLDTGTTSLLFKTGGSPGSPAIAAIPPAPLPIRLDLAGNFTINNGGSNLNMIVSEIYACISPTA
jgi:hypothetical protein